MKKNVSPLKQLIYILLGNIILAASVAYLVLPNDILSGGVAGIAVALQPIFPIDPVWVIDGLTIGLFIVGAIFLGKKFALKTVLSSIIYPMLITFFSWTVTLFPPQTFTLDPIIASGFSGFGMGVGLGLVFRVDASTGGMDILALMLHKYAKIDEGNSVMIIDILTVMLGLYTYGLEDALVGVLSVIVSGIMINRMIMLGAQAAMNVMIVSDQWETINKELMKDLERGVTLIEAKGGYKQTNRPVVMCVIMQQQYPELERLVNAIDPHAFMIVNNVHSVHGEGFSRGLVQ